MTGMNAYKSILKSLLVLAIPTVVEQILSTLLQYVDTAMVGQLGERATAAVSLTMSINWLVNSLASAAGIAILSLIARAIGEKNEERSAHIAGQGFFLTLAAGLLLTVICVGLSSSIPVWMHAAADVRPDAAAYFAIISLPLVFRTANIVMGSALRAAKDTRTPMRINLLCNLANAGLNALFIYGLGMGVRGAAIATAVSYTASGILMTVFAWRKKALRWRASDVVPDAAVLKACGSIGLPVMGTGTASCLGYVVFAGMVSGMGTTTFAAHSIAITAEELFYIPGYGLRTATSAMIGHAIGERDPEKLRLTETVSIALTVGAMLMTGTLLFFTAYPLMRIFTSSLPVARLGAEMLRLVAFTEPFFGLMVVLEGIAYGKGRTRGIFVVETISMWGIRILFTWFCTHVWMTDLRAVWYCMIADNIFKALMLLTVYAAEKRKKRKCADGFA